MAGFRFDHVNIRTAHPAAVRSFFVEVVGLHEGARPPFDFPGHWLYQGEAAVVHIVTVTDDAAPAPGGAFDHVAFRGEDYDGVRARLEGAGYEFFERVVPGSGDRQVFVALPGGVKVELDFAPDGG